MPKFTDSEGFEYEVSISGKEEFGTKKVAKSIQTCILASNDHELEINVRCTKPSEDTAAPNVLIEVYIDGISRTVVQPKVGRGLGLLEFAVVDINRGIVMTEDGVHIFQKFRFVELDLDDAILNSRVVSRSGQIEVRIVHADSHADTSETFQFDLPERVLDRGAITFLGGDLNNTVGIRFDDGDKSLHDTKHVRLAKSVEYMLGWQHLFGRKLLAGFTFIYGTDDMLNTFGVIPREHKLFSKEIECRKSLPLGTRPSYRERARKPKFSAMTTKPRPSPRRKQRAKQKPSHHSDSDEYVESDDEQISRKRGRASSMSQPTTPKNMPITKGFPTPPDSIELLSYEDDYGTIVVDISPLASKRQRR